MANSIKEVKYSFEDMKQFVAWIGTTLSKQWKIKPESVIGVLNGGAMPALMVSSYFKIPLYWVRANSYEGRDRKEVKLGYREYCLQDIKDRHVVVVDEIIDSGSTIKAVYDWLLTLNPKSVMVVSWVVKSGAKLPLIDTVCMTQESKDTWIIFPWEFSNE